MNFFTRDQINVRPRVWLMMSLPRCGKTTWANQHQASLNATIVSCDDIRRALGVEFDPKLEGRVWQTFGLMVKALVARGQHLIIDNCGATVRERKLFVDLAREGKIDLFFVRVEMPDAAELKLRCEATGFRWEVILEHQAKWQELTDMELSVGSKIRA